MKKSLSVDLMGLAAELPPTIARSHVEKYLGGIVSAKRLANLDYQGLGPKRMRIGKKVVYLTVDLLSWLQDRAMALA